MNCRELLVFSCTFYLLAASCSKDGASGEAASVSGKGGSLARFTISGNYLYLADWSQIKVFDITNASSPVEKSPVNVGFAIETIFPYKDKLFIGAPTGMFV